MGPKLNLLYLMALCRVRFASSVLADHGSSRFAFVPYAAVMALVEMVSASLSAYGLRAPFLGGRLRPKFTPTRLPASGR